MQPQTSTGSRVVVTGCTGLDSASLNTYDKDGRLISSEPLPTRRTERGNLLVTYSYVVRPKIEEFVPATTRSGKPIIYDKWNKGTKYGKRYGR